MRSLATSLWCAAMFAASAPIAARRFEPPRNYADLRRAVAALDPVARTAGIAAFLAGRRAGDPDTLRARLLLASDRLRSFAFDQAAKDFRRVLADVPPGERDLAARGWYGLAQCEEMRGRIENSIEALQRLQREYRDLRHARFAAASLRRLRNRDSLAIGRAVPEFTARDVTGRSQSSASRRGRPVLIVFFAPRDAQSVDRVTRMLRAFRDHGGRAADSLVFAVERDAAFLAAFLQKRDQSVWSGRVVLPCGGAFLDPVLVQFSVQALPDSFLLGPDGTLLLRSPTPAAVRRALGVLSDK